MSEIKRIDPKYTPSEDTKKLLALSQKEAEKLKERDLRCPICHFRIAGIFSDRIGHIRIKCSKCKFEGIINLAYFRLLQRNRYSLSRKHRFHPKG